MLLVPCDYLPFFGRALRGIQNHGNQRKQTNIHKSSLGWGTTVLLLGGLCIVGLIKFCRSSIWNDFGFHWIWSISWYCKLVFYYIRLRSPWPGKNQPLLIEESTCLLGQRHEAFQLPLCWTLGISRMKNTNQNQLALGILTSPTRSFWAHSLQHQTENPTAPYHHLPARTSGIAVPRWTLWRNQLQNFKRSSYEIFSEYLGGPKLLRLQVWIWFPHGWAGMPMGWGSRFSFVWTSGVGFPAVGLGTNSSNSQCHRKLRSYIYIYILYTYIYMYKYVCKSVCILVFRPFTNFIWTSGVGYPLWFRYYLDHCPCFEHLELVSPRWVCEHVNHTCKLTIGKPIPGVQRKVGNGMTIRKTPCGN